MDTHILCPHIDTLQNMRPQAHKSTYTQIDVYMHDAHKNTYIGTHKHVLALTQMRFKTYALTHTCT